MNSKDFIKIALFPVIVLIIHFAITYGSNLYYTNAATDVIMHFIGGISIALAANAYISIQQRRGAMGVLNPLNRFLMIISIMMLAAVLWEIMEFSADTFIYHYPHFQASNFDTMKDLIMGLFGGTLTALLLKSTKRS